VTLTATETCETKRAPQRVPRASRSGLVATAGIASAAIEWQRRSAWARRTPLADTASGYGGDTCIPPWMKTHGVLRLSPRSTGTGHRTGRVAGHAHPTRSPGVAQEITSGAPTNAGGDGPEAGRTSARTKTEAARTKLLPKSRWRFNGVRRKHRPMTGCHPEHTETRRA
jgi:hypothetical protein